MEPPLTKYDKNHTEQRGWRPPKRTPVSGILRALFLRRWIAELKAQRKALAQEKKEAQRQLKLEQRRRRRVMHEVKTLTDRG